MPGVVETTHSFATNEVVTSTLLNNIIDQTTFTATALDDGSLSLTAAGKIKVATGGITATQLAASAVTSTAILDATIANAKISASAAISLSKLASEALPSGITVATANIVDANVTTAKILDANVTAAKLNGAQTGTAPVFGVRAWVNFDGTTSADLAGTYTRAATTVTVTTASNHGLIVGHKVYLDFASGITDGDFIVATVPTTTTFTVTTATSGTITSTVVSLKRRLIRASGNVANVTTLGTGQFAVNFAVALPDANYARSGFANHTSSSVVGLVAGNSTTATTAQSCDISSSNSTNGTEVNVSVVNAIFVG